MFLNVLLVFSLASALVVHLIFVPFMGLQVVLNLCFGGGCTEKGARAKSTGPANTFHYYATYKRSLSHMI